MYSSNIIQISKNILNPSIVSIPKKEPRKSYMTFSITPLEIDLTFLVEHHLIERLIEHNSENAKGTPVFIQP